MNGFFQGYGSLLLVAGIIGFMVWSHSRGHGGGMGGSGCCGKGEDHNSNTEQQRASEKPEGSDKGVRSGSGGCH